MSLVRKKLEITYFDQLKEVLHGWQTEPVQLSSGPLDFVTETVSCSDFSLLRFSLAPRIADRAVVWPGVFGFFLAERPQVWCGLEIDPPALVITRPGLETRSVLEPGFRSLEFYFAENDLAEHPLGCRLEGVALEPERSVFPISDAAASTLRAAADAVFSWPTPSTFWNGAAARNRLLDLLQGIISPHLDTVPNRGYPRRRNSAHLVLAALDEIDRLGAVNATLPQILADLGVSRRALEKAFKSTMQISPGQYLIAYRLNKMRDQLHKGNSQVLDSVFEAGLNDPSRVARQYRRLFGELPSHTLVRSRSNMR
jgi:AraC-like DNA-binding protein